MTHFELSEVSLCYGQHTVLRDVDLSIPQGQRVALIGRSGCGKTSLLKLFNGINAAHTGKVISLGQDIAQISAAQLHELRSHMAFILQNHGLVGNLSVLRNVLAGAYGQQTFFSSLRDFLLPSLAKQEAVLEILQRVHIPEKLFSRVDSLSLGQQQRVAIARAVYQKAQAIFADEPVASLDPSTSHEILQLLRDIAAERNVTVIASLHDMSLVRHGGYFQRVIALSSAQNSSGQPQPAQILYDGAPHELSDAVLEQVYAK
jgi:phosphonate transport system ATP-binding protein